MEVRVEAFVEAFVSVKDMVRYGQIRYLHGRVEGGGGARGGLVEHGAEHLSLEGVVLTLRLHHCLHLVRDLGARFTGKGPPANGVR